MEMTAGVHDRSVWEKKVSIFFKKSDPLYPCSATFMPQDVRPWCYTYLTPHLFEAAGGSLASPTPLDFEKAFVLCDRIPFAEKENRKYCFGGFGKEFIVLAHARDIRSIEGMGDAELGRVISWCELSPHTEGNRACMGSALASLYWGGENKSETAIRFCSLLQGGEKKTDCFFQLMGEIAHYERNPDKRREFCELVPVPQHEKCRTFLNV